MHEHGVVARVRYSTYQKDLGHGLGQIKFYPIAAGLTTTRPESR